MSSTATRSVCQSCGGVIWPDCQHICFATLPIVVYTCSICGDDVGNVGMHVCLKTQEESSNSINPPPDLVNHPPHYKRGGLECIDVIEALDLPFHLANVLKYIWRAGEKDESNYIDDLRKSRWYLDRFISLLEKEGAEIKKYEQESAEVGKK